eukprot:m.128815 g.128815  ORF g.128815 m.128815 type:complete len:87 (+) comp13640_c0_seq1:104-364(+)
MPDQDRIASSGTSSCTFRDTFCQESLVVTRGFDAPSACNSPQWRIGIRSCLAQFRKLGGVGDKSFLDQPSLRKHFDLKGVTSSVLV